MLDIGLKDVYYFALFMGKYNIDHRCLCGMHFIHNSFAALIDPEDDKGDIEAIYHQAHKQHALPSTNCSLCLTLHLCDRSRVWFSNHLFRIRC